MRVMYSCALFGYVHGVRCTLQNTQYSARYPSLSDSDVVARRPGNEYWSHMSYMNLADCNCAPSFTSQLCQPPHGQKAAPSHLRAASLMFHRHNRYRIDLRLFFHLCSCTCRYYEPSASPKTNGTVSVNGVILCQCATAMLHSCSR